MTDSEIVRKVEAACAFGTPNALVTAAIVDEVTRLVKVEDKLEEVRQLFNQWAVGNLWHDEVMTKLEGVLRAAL